MIDLPVLARNLKGMEVVEDGGVAVVTARNLAAGLEYQTERAVHVVYNRNKESFRDGGVVDLTLRGAQIENPLNTKIDTAIVRMFVAGRADGNGAGIQEVRVFTKWGAMKVCMKSNQPKAVMVQEMLLDLYEQVENGQLMGAERFGRLLEGLAQGLAALQQEVTHLKSRPPVHINLPDDTALPITLERKRHHSWHMCGGLKFPEVRELVLNMRRSGTIYEEIARGIRDRWPLDPAKHVSKSAIQRFWDAARTGRLKEFGIDAASSAGGGR